MSDIHIKGGKELNGFLQQLPAKIEKNILRSALGKGANVIKKKAKELAPIKDGELKATIRVSTGAKKGRVTAKVKVGSKKVFYSKFVEFGTAAHIISIADEATPSRFTRRGIKKYAISTINKNVKAGGSLFIAGNFVGQSVNHPGSRAKPFLRPALDSEAQNAINAVGLQIKKRLTKAGINTPDIVLDEVDNE